MADSTPTTPTNRDTWDGAPTFRPHQLHGVTVQRTLDLESWVAVCECGWTSKLDHPTARDAHTEGDKHLAGDPLAPIRRHRSW